MKAYLPVSKLIFALALVLSIGACKQKSPTLSYHKISGETWGTYYRITIQTDKPERFHGTVKNILRDFDDALSTYVPSSAISKFNKDKMGYELTQHQDQYFAPVLERSRALKESTEGYLDVTVMPLLNYWGFGYKAERRSASDVDSNEVIRLQSLIGLDKISRTPSGDKVMYSKSSPEVEVDFSALAKGYGIDVIAEYFDNAGIENYLIDIGGEARAKGVNDQGTPWTLAINKPYPDAEYTTQELILQLKGMSIATSGNYREMYEVNGKVYGHILNPITGYPEPSDVLSASIIAKDCMTADGLATACVAAGMERSKEILAAHPDVHGCLIFDADGDKQLEKYFTNGFESMVISQ